MIDTGQRDKLVTIQQLTESRGASGFPVETWSTLATVFMAREEAAVGHENFTAEQRAARSDTRWTMLFRDDMDPDVLDVPKTRRLVYRGRSYNITSANPLGHRDSIELVTQASVG